MDSRLQLYLKLQEESVSWVPVERHRIRGLGARGSVACASVDITDPSLVAGLWAQRSYSFREKALRPQHQATIA